MNQDAEAYLNKYLSSLPEDKKKKVNKFDSFHFCLTENEANYCANLVKSGIKRATSSLEWCFTVGDEDYPEEGELDIVTNWNKEPQCIIEITSVEVRPFNKINEEFALEEGEGDKSIESWRNVHWDFFCKECRELGLKATESMPIVLQRFKVVHP
jgi:uncharacterized protein YhfF